jgi:hypothetical protein
MATRVKVCVTQKEIDEGNPVDTASCPVALALKREFHPQNINVTKFFTRLYFAGYLVKAMNNPVRVQRFIQDFDSGKSVKPFCFFFKG